MQSDYSVEGCHILLALNSSCSNRLCCPQTTRAYCKRGEKLEHQLVLRHLARCVSSCYQLDPTELAVWTTLGFVVRS